MYQLGLIDFNAYEEFVQQENEVIECVRNRNFSCAFTKFNKIHEMFRNLSGFNRSFNFLKTKKDDSSPLVRFLQNSTTHHAIHVGNNSFHLRNNKVRIHLKLDKYESAAHWVAELISHYRILIWSGQLDLAIPYTGTVKFLRNLNFSAAAEYKTAKRITWRVDDEIAGYAKVAGNLTEVLIRNAGKYYPLYLKISQIDNIFRFKGHSSPKDQPKWTLDMMQRFTQHRGFH